VKFNEKRKSGKRARGDASDAIGAKVANASVFGRWRQNLLQVEFDESDDDNYEHVWTEADHMSMVDRVFRTLNPPASAAQLAATAERFAVAELDNSVKAIYGMHNGQADVDEYRWGLLPGVMSVRWLPLDDWVRVRDHPRLKSIKYLPKGEVLIGENLDGHGMGIVLLNLRTGAVSTAQYGAWENDHSGWGRVQEYASIGQFFDEVSRDVDGQANLLREQVEELRLTEE